MRRASVALYITLTPNCNLHIMLMTSQECSTKFDDGRFFIRGEKGKEVPVCVSCEERRLKA